MIAPILDEIATEYRAAQDRQAQHRREPADPPFGIRGIPTLILFKNGTVEAQKVGAVANRSSRLSWTATCEAISATRAATGPTRPRRRGGNRDGNRDGNAATSARPRTMAMDQPFRPLTTPRSSVRPSSPPRNSMNLTELKRQADRRPGRSSPVDGRRERLARSRKQDIIFSDPEGARPKGETSTATACSRSCRTASASCARPTVPTSPARTTSTSARPDPALQPAHRRHDLRPDPPPKDGERYFALLKVGEINFDSPDSSRSQGAVREPDAAASDASA